MKSKDGQSGVKGYLILSEALDPDSPCRAPRVKNIDEFHLGCTPNRATGARPSAADTPHPPADSGRPACIQAAADRGFPTIVVNAAFCSAPTALARPWVAASGIDLRRCSTFACPRHCRSSECAACVSRSPATVDTSSAGEY